MLTTIITAVSILCLVAIAILKAYNLANKNEGYALIHIFTGFGVAALCWILIFLSFAAAIEFEETITNGGDTYVITSNDYVQLSIFLPFANLMFGLITIMWVMEIIAMFTRIEIKPKMARGR